MSLLDRLLRRGAGFSALQQDRSLCVFPHFQEHRPDIRQPQRFLSLALVLTQHDDPLGKVQGASNVCWMRG